MRMMTRRRGRAESGAAAVEFAIIVPVLLLLVLGIVDFGYAFGQKLALNHAAREGARMAVVESSGADTQAEIAQLVSDSAGTLVDPLDTTQVIATVAGTGTSATCGPGGALDIGDELEVSVDYDATPLVPLPFLGGTISLSSSAVFRCEW